MAPPMQAALADASIDMCPAWVVDKAKSSKTKFEGWVELANSVITGRAGDSVAISKDDFTADAADLQKAAQALTNMLREAKKV